MDAHVIDPVQPFRPNPRINNNHRIEQLHNFHEEIIFERRRENIKMLVSISFGGLDYVYVKIASINRSFMINLFVDGPKKVKRFELAIFTSNHKQNQKPLQIAIRQPQT